MTGHKQCEFTVFRFRRRAYVFSRRHCGLSRGRVTAALSSHAREKVIFVFDKGFAVESLEAEFGFASNNLVDVRELATENNFPPKLAGMVTALVGGEMCTRAKNIPGNALPSMAAMQHLDVVASVIYKFGIQLKGLSDAEMEDLRDDTTRRERKRERERN